MQPAQGILAILVSSTDPVDPPFGEMNHFFSEVVYFASKRKMIAYVVTLEQLSALSPPITGWTYRTSRWQREEFPLPMVVYNRIPSRKIERTRRFQKLKQKLRDKKIPLFNHTFLDKWTVHQLLYSVEKLKPFLPETHRFDGRHSLNLMLSKYPTIFLKPNHGSLGRGIYKISRHKARFTSEYNTPNGSIVKSFPRFHSLLLYLSKRIGKNYIIQEGLPILHYQSCPVDFRVLMQKNGQGEWAVTSLVARIGPENRFVSNISRGGRVAKVLATLKRCHISQPKRIQRQLLLLAHQATRAIDQGQEGDFGELGIDLAVTTSGRPYILEVNSKPSKTDNTLPQNGNSPSGRPSVHRLLDYARYLMTSDK